MSTTPCRYDRDAKAHLLREHKPECADRACKGCLPCTHEDGNPVRHCRTRNRCTSHLAWEEFTCPKCLGKIRDRLTAACDLLALMPGEAVEQGIHSEPANLAGPHADYVTTQWRLINADRDGESVEELDLRDPYTCLTMHERTIREHLGHDADVLVSATVERAADYLAWALTDLSRDEDGALLLSALLGDLGVLVTHMEAALRDARTPDRGAPCPECVAAMGERKEELQATGVPEDEWPRLRAPRLVRFYGHWCIDPDCTRPEHHVTDLGDVWRCPTDREHEWSHADYSRWVEERTGKRRVS